jgi:hypothetical protein
VPTVSSSKKQPVRKLKTMITHDESYMDISIKSKLKKLPSALFKQDHIKTNAKSTNEGDLGIIKINPADIERNKP